MASNIDRMNQHPPQQGFNDGARHRMEFDQVQREIERNMEMLLSNATPYRHATKKYTDHANCIRAWGSAQCTGMQIEPSQITLKFVWLTIKFRDMKLEVKLVPVLDGKVFTPTDKMCEVERQKKIYTKMLQEIVKLHEPDYTSSLGYLRGISNMGFIFERGILPHGDKTTVLWEKFMEKLHNTG